MRVTKNGALSKLAKTCLFMIFRREEEGFAQSMGTNEAVCVS